MGRRERTRVFHSLVNFTRKCNVRTAAIVVDKRQHEGMSPSEKAFFGGERGFAKNYLKPLRRKRLPK